MVWVSSPLGLVLGRPPSLGDVGPQQKPDQGRSRGEPTEPANPGRNPSPPGPSQGKIGPGRRLSRHFLWPPPSGVGLFGGLVVSLPGVFRCGFAWRSSGVVLAVVSFGFGVLPARFGVGVKIALMQKLKEERKGHRRKGPYSFFPANLGIRAILTPTLNQRDQS